jgi:pilus assembly protein Flp/PilA
MLSYLVDLTSRVMLMGRLRDEEGQGLAEYALILAFIAVVAILALTFLGTTISSLLSNVAEKL